MKDPEDKELQDYINGSDKVSATYQSLQADQALQDEKPSAALDESILQAARESVKGSSTQKKVIPLQAYSIAASVCVAVLAVSLFLNNESELTGADFEAFSIPAADTPIAEMMSIDEATAVQNNENTSLVIESLEINARRAESPAPQLEADSLEATALSAASELRVETSAAQAERAVDLGSQEELLELAIVAEPEEILPPTLVYRQSVETWLLEIQRLSDIGNETELAEERRLFAESYPDIDIDSALTELQLSN